MNPWSITTRSTPGLVTFVLPAKNEAQAIDDTLRRLPRTTLSALGLRSEIFVLDGHSRDATAQIARRWGATVVPDPEPGKGSALRHARRMFRGDYVVMLDADGSYPPDAIPSLLAPLLRDEADVVMGDRYPLPGSMKNTHRLGNALLSLVATVLYGNVCPDVCTGLWAFRAETLREMPLRSRGFEIEAEMYALATRMGLRLSHIRIDYLPRKGAAKLSIAPDGFRIIGRLVTTRWASARPERAAPQVGAPRPGPSPEVKV